MACGSVLSDQSPRSGLCWPFAGSMRGTPVQLCWPRATGCPEGSPGLPVFEDKEQLWALSETGELSAVQVAPGSVGPERRAGEPKTLCREPLRGQTPRLTPCPVRAGAARGIQGTVEAPACTWHQLPPWGRLSGASEGELRLFSPRKEEEAWRGWGTHRHPPPSDGHALPARVWTVRHCPLWTVLPSSAQPFSRRPHPSPNREDWRQIPLQLATS